MLMFLSRKTRNKEAVAPAFYKDWSNTSHELECLGKRLDAVRGILSGYKTKRQKASWSYTHWSQVEAIVLRKWQQTLRLKDTGLRQAGKVDTGPVIDYDWWEGSDEVAMGLPMPAFIANLYTHSDLDWSWAKAQEEKLQKARQGLA